MKIFSIFSVDQERAARSRSLIAGWLLLVAVTVAVMVMLGGATRLTHSGLSMVQWQPLMGVLPPLTEGAWRAVFELYKAYPEFQKINQGMTLVEFKSIFYFEYAHRMLGRFIGLEFALPFIWFLLTGRIERGRRLALFGLFCLGGVQGIIGWWMVKSGLVNQPDVSHYRLTVHLGVAVLILGGLLWAALDLMIRGTKAAAPGLRQGANCLLGIIFLQILTGGLVAGLNAGFIYNSFPMMNQYWFPPELWDLSPFWVNMLENVVTVQFDHRIGAYVCVILTSWLWWRCRSSNLSPNARTALNLVVGAMFLQFALGIATLLWVVPVPIAVLHQGGALLLFAAAIYLSFRLHRG